MEEKRRHKRLDLDVAIQLERIDKDGITTLRFFHVNVHDISRSGLSFVTEQEMEIGTYYDTKIQIWTKEVIDAVIELFVMKISRTDAINTAAFLSVFLTQML